MKAQQKLLSKRFLISEERYLRERERFHRSYKPRLHIFSITALVANPILTTVTSGANSYMSYLNFIIIAEFIDIAYSQNLVILEKYLLKRLCFSKILGLQIIEHNIARYSFKLPSL